VTVLPKENTCANSVTSDSSETPLHNWNDKRHAITKPKRKRSDTPLHPSVAAIFAYFEHTGQVPKPELSTTANLPPPKP